MSFYEDFDRRELNITSLSLVLLSVFSQCQHSFDVLNHHGHSTIGHRQKRTWSNIPARSAAIGSEVGLEDDLLLRRGAVIAVLLHGGG